MLQHNSSDQLKSLWDEFDKIQVIIQRIRDLQGHVNPSVLNHRQEIPAFEKWLLDNGSVYSATVSIEKWHPAMKVTAIAVIQVSKINDAKP